MPDYPAPGIRFQDLTPLLPNGEAFSSVVNALQPQAAGCDVVAAIEARGCIFAAALSPGSRVLLVDDVLATGGTASAAMRLIQRAGGHVATFATVLEIVGLPGREVLTSAHSQILVHSLFRA